MLTLKQWRRARDITQASMADMLGIHVATYQNWEKEPEKISVSMADKIVSILGIEPNEIIFKSDPAEAEVTA